MRFFRSIYAAVQYHPEYISRPMRPSPPYLGLILAATGKLKSFLSNVKKQSLKT
jgi:CTP synthase